MPDKIKSNIKAHKIYNKILACDKIVEYTNFYPLTTSMHWHDFYELELVMGGSGTLICNNKKYPLKPGLISFLTPADLHKYELTQNTRIIKIQFSDESVSKEILDFFFNLQENTVYIDKEKINKINSFYELLNKNHNISSSDNLYNSKILEAILLLLKNEFKTTENSYTHMPHSIQKALLYINSHFKENPKMSDVAKMLFLNEHYFCSLFKENTGESYKDYLRNLKLNHAANLIQHTVLPLTQISFECGYTSQSNFNRDFKNFFGISPSAMRNK